MQFRRSTNHETGKALRMVADALMIQFSLLCGMLTISVVGWLAQAEGAPQSLRQVLLDVLANFAVAAWPLTLITLAIAYLSGFYTYGRFYKGRYKALIVFQAVTQSYLLFGFLAGWLLNDRDLPQSGLVVAWLVNVLLFVGARLWHDVWLRSTSSKLPASRIRGVAEAPRVLVIGGAGYIGSSLVRQLLERGYRVRVLDLLLYGKEPLGDVVDHPNFELMPGDFRNVSTVVQAIHGAEQVVHLGAIVGDPACEFDRDLSTEINLSATRMVAEVAKVCGVQRFIFASTCSVYGACDEILDERSQTKPVSHYGHTKLAAERVLLDLADENFAPVILRFATIFGLSGRTRFDLVVNLLAAKAKIDGEIPVHGGDQWRPFVHVDDAAASIVTALAAPLDLVQGEIFNVGSNRLNYTILQVAQAVHEMVPGATLDVREDARDPRNYRVSFLKIQQRLGYEPKYSLAEGIEQVLEAIARGDVEDYRDAKHSNDRSLRQSPQRLLRLHPDQELLTKIATGA